MSTPRPRAPEVVFLVIAIVSILVVVSMLVLLAAGSGNWFTVIGSALTTISAGTAFITMRRTRRQSDNDAEHDDQDTSSR